MKIQSIPILDLTSPDEDHLAEQCFQACSKYGFFMVQGHGVPEELIQCHAEAQRNFFYLPLEEKMKIVADKNNRGYTPAYEETLDPENSSSGDAHEGLYFGREVGPDTPEASLPLHGPNQWPSDNLLGSTYRVTVEKYMQEMTRLGYRLLEILSMALGLPKDYFFQYFECPMTFLRPLHYLPMKSNERDGKFAAGAHTDYGMLTILYTDGTPGLEIYSDGVWQSIEPVEGAFIINLGDMLHRWTAGKFSSTLHRVINRIGKERFSTAFFFEPSFDSIVEVLPSCRTTADWKEKFPIVTSGQHLLQKYDATHANYNSSS